MTFNHSTYILLNNLKRTILTIRFFYGYDIPIHNFVHSLHSKEDTISSFTSLTNLLTKQVFK